MGIFLGSNEISNVYVGGNTAEAVYLGSELVWPTGPPWWPTEWEPITATAAPDAMTQAQGIAAQRGIDHTTVATLDFGFDLAQATNAAGMLYFWGGLKHVAIKNTSNVTDMGAMFLDCKALEELPVLDTSSVTEMAQMFIGCGALREVEFTDCSNVISADFMLGTSVAETQAASLERLILPGLTRGFELQNTQMSASALNDFFDSLGTASGSQTINITGAPGAATCDKSIATAKGWTITG